mgnify:CR=1 FL=1
MLPTATKKSRDTLILGDECVDSTTPVIKTPIEECVDDITDLFGGDKCPTKLKLIASEKKQLADEELLGRRLQAVVNEYSNVMEPNDLLEVIMQLCEDTIFMPDKRACNKRKRDLVVKLMRKSMNTDTTTIHHIIANNTHKIKKSTWFRKNKLKIRRVFFILVGHLQKII